MIDPWDDPAWGQRLVAELVNQRDLALARRHKLTGEPILAPRTPMVGHWACSRCGCSKDSQRCPECGSTDIVWAAT